MTIGDKVIHKLTSEIFLIIGTISYSKYYTPDAYICINNNYERREFRECEITPYKEPETETKEDEN